MSLLKPITLFKTLLLATLLSVPGVTISAPSSQHKLEQINSQIKNLEQDLNQNKEQRQEAQKRLRTVEVRIGKLSQQITKIKRQQRTLNRQLTKLQKQQRELEEKLGLHHDILKQHIIARFRQGEKGYLKILLNQQDPASMGRQMVYYQYLNKARIETIKTTEQNLVELARIEQESTQRQQELDQSAAELNKQKQALAQDKSQRAEILAKINEKIQSQEQQLQELVENARRLKNIVSRIQQEPAHKTTHFAKLRGKLPWPTKGRLGARFGQSREFGKLTWDGVLIKATEGADVKAIADGKVVFSDWLRGYGLLVILDHGDGYLSLYGQNQSLHHHVGDQVRQGDVIANVGSSGGNRQAGLYFEVRVNGTPSNPVKWCKGSKPS